MPISQLSKGVQYVISFLPGTYGTSLVRNHAMHGVFEEMKAQAVPDKVIQSLQDAIDCNLYFFDHKVSMEMMYAVLIGFIILLIGLYIIMNIKKRKTFSEIRNK